MSLPDSYYAAVSKKRELERLEAALRAGRIAPTAHGNVLVRIAELRRELHLDDERSTD